MERSDNLYVLGIGPEEDFKNSRAGLFYEQDEVGQKALPAFPTADVVDEYVLALLNNPDTDTNAKSELEAGRFRAIHLSNGAELADMAMFLEAQYVKWIPTLEEDGKFYRMPK